MDLARRPLAGRRDHRGLALAFLAGLLGFYQLPELPPLYCYLLLLLPALLLPRARPLIGAVLLGAAMAHLDARARLADRWPPQRHGEIHELPGWVAAFPEQQGQVTRFVFHAHHDEFPRRIRVAHYGRGEQMAVPAPGGCLHLQLRLRSPSGSQNPGGFDYERWLFSEGLGATASIRAWRPCAAAEQLQLALSPARRLAIWRGELRAALLGVDEHPARAFAAALLVGDRSGLSDQQWQQFRQTGTAHLVAISGLHLGLLATAGYFAALLLLKLAPAAWLRRWPAPYLAMGSSTLIAVLYAGLAGFALPTLRALLMLIAVQFCLRWRRQLRPSQVLLAVAVLILMLDPVAVLAPGFWLSFGAVAVILWVVVGRRQRPLPALLKLQLAVAVGLLPVSLLLFQGASLIGPLANLIAIPAMSLLLPLLLLGSLLQWWLPVVGAPLWQLLLDALQLLELLISQLAGLGAAGWISLGIDLPQALLAAAAVALLLLPRGLPVRGLGLIGLLAVLVPTPQLPAAELRLAVLDVGQGSAAVLTTRNHAMVFDAGPAYQQGFDAGRDVVLPYLRQRRISRLDRLMISHDDSDHRGGASAVMDEFQLLTSPCTAGEQWRWDGVTFSVLHPAADTHWQGNNASCVLRVAGQNWALLLAGDIERQAEQALVRQYGDGLRAQLLLAPHHGSATSSSAQFLAAVRPEWVIYSAGWRHRFGHPHEEVVARYRRAGVSQLNTASSGALDIRLGPKRIELREFRARRRIWHRRSADQP